MNMRWAVVLGAAVVIGLAAYPLFAQVPGGFGPGSMGMGAMGGGMMGGNMMGGNMMGRPTSIGTGQPISLDRALDVARQAIAKSGYTGLGPGHIMEFTNHFYVAVKDKSTGRGAFELLVDRYTGFVHPEPGPNMMWNTRYGHMVGSGMGQMGMGGMRSGGMMGQPSSPSARPTLTLDRARVQAQLFLDTRLAGAKISEAMEFPGYYTLDVERNAKMVGMLSVNAYTGQVWYHTWHGGFIQEKDVD